MFIVSTEHLNIEDGQEVGSPRLLFKNLDLTPIHPILWKGLHKGGPVKPVIYDPTWDLRALMLRQLLQIPYMKDLVNDSGANPTRGEPAATEIGPHARPTSPRRRNASA